MNKRQAKILNYIEQKETVSRKEIEEYINLYFDSSKVTVIRDLDFLLKEGLIEKSGAARGIKYQPKLTNELLRKFDVEEYFSVDIDNRTIKYEQFNFEIFNSLKSIFSKSECEHLEKVNSKYATQVKSLSSTILRKEFERLLIELSWKSSQIEGNTYSLLDTEALIKENQEADGHKKEEAVMILNHKRALECIFENKDYYKNLSLVKIAELHEILTRDLSISRGLRTAPVGITGTNYKPLSNQHQIRESMEKLVTLINKTENVIEKALIAVLMISYIQPFEDGNKRTGRILANAILFSNNYCPLSYRSVKESEYKKAVILFYENNSLDYFKQIFMEQFEFAVKKYFIE